MKEIVRRNAFYAQSGGVSVVINASACGVIETARGKRQIGKVYAGRHGIVGALTEDLIDVGRESPATIRFFFSSRRRHTRLTCDWSSDVCSSDLGRPAAPGQGQDAAQDD